MTTVRFRYGITFTVSVALAWTLTTTLIALSAWSGDRTPAHLGSWAGLWVFTIGVPTLQALRLHRGLDEIRTRCAIPDGARRHLEHTRFVLLMCGTMVVIIVFGMLAAP